jgi:hypothetical protein
MRLTRRSADRRPNPHRVALHAPLGVCMALAAAAASAHHSYTMFDPSKELVLQGTVRELQWTNPHCFIQLLVPRDGGATEWSIEMASPLHLVRRGWRPGLLKAGDQVTIVIHPMRDNSAGGDFVRGTGSDGKPLGEGAER